MVQLQMMENTTYAVAIFAQLYVEKKINKKERKAKQ